MTKPGAPRRRPRALLAAIGLVVAVATVACRHPGAPSGPGGEEEGFERVLRGTEPAPWDVRLGVEQITVTGASPGEPLTLYGDHRRKLLTLIADQQGQAQFAYLPPEHETLPSGSALDYSQLDVADGTTVGLGLYALVDDSVQPRLATQVLTVPGRDDVPDSALYERQHLSGAHLDLVGNAKAGTSVEDGYGYIEM